MDLFDQVETEKWAIFEDEWEGEGFTQIPNSIVRSPEVSLAAVGVYGLLKSFAWSNPTAHPGKEKLIRYSGVGKDALATALRECEDAGLLEVRRRGQGKTNLYVFKSLSPTRSREFRDPEVGKSAPKNIQYKNIEETRFAHIEECVRIMERIEGYPRKDNYDYLLKKSNANPDVDLVRVLHQLESWAQDHPGETKSWRGRLTTFVRNAAARPTTPKGTPQTRTGQPGTPDAGIRALEEYENPRLGINDLGYYAGVARRWDFNSNEEPPWWVMKELDNDPLILKRVRRVVQNA